jgi:hypothetical protein
MQEEIALLVFLNKIFSSDLKNTLAQYLIMEEENLIISNKKNLIIEQEKIA